MHVTPPPWIAHDAKPTFSRGLGGNSGFRQLVDRSGGPHGHPELTSSSNGESCEHQGAAGARAWQRWPLLIPAPTPALTHLRSGGVSRHDAAPALQNFISEIRAAGNKEAEKVRVDKELGKIRKKFAADKGLSGTASRRA